MPTAGIGIKYNIFNKLVFNSSLETGLTTNQVRANEALYGRNEYRKRKKVTLC